MNRIIAIAVSFLIAVSIFSGCGSASDNKPAETKSESAVSNSSTKETNKVIETTPDGGTVEEDADGNIVTKDKDGKIKSVKDKNGKKVDVGEYIKTHGSSVNKSSAKTSSDSSSVSKDTKSKNSSKSSKSKSASKSSKKSSENSSKKSDNKSSKSSKSGKKSSEVNEEKIPEVVVTVPDVDEQETIDGF